MADGIDHAAYLTRDLTDRAEAAHREGSSSEVERFVLTRGRPYSRLAASPPELMEPNACFENAMAYAQRTGMTYVEGFALVAVPGLHAYDHAWCADADGSICELTWREPGFAYLGVAFAAEYVARRFARMRHPEHGLLRGDGCGPLLDGEERDWRA